MRSSRVFCLFIAVTMLLPLELPAMSGELSQALSWDQIFGWLRRPKPPYGSRGDNLCALSPADIENETLMLSFRPMFLWRGDAYAIALRTPNSETHLWEQVLPGQTDGIKLKQETLHRWQYSGQPLQPGKTYEFLLYRRVDDPAPKRSTFRILANAEQAEVREMLENIQAKSERKKLTKEAIAVQRVQALMERSLWSDAVVEAYRIKQPSVELLQVMQKIPDKICKQVEDKAAR